MKRTVSYPLLVLVVLCAILLPDAKAMGEAPFARLLGQLDSGFSSDQVNLVRTVSATNTFTSDQVRRMIERLSFSSTQLEALEIAADRIEDPENSFVILEAFTFSSDKSDAQDILSRAEPIVVEPEPYPIVIQDRYARQGILTVRVWDDDAFAELQRALDDASFASDRIVLLEAAARSTDGFTAAQLGRIVQTMAFSRDRVESVRTLRYRVIDLQPDELAQVLGIVDQEDARLDVLELLAHTLQRGAATTPIVGTFNFTRNQDEARRLLSRAGR